MFIYSGDVKAEKIEVGMIVDSLDALYDTPAEVTDVAQNGEWVYASTTRGIRRVKVGANVKRYVDMAA